MEYSTKGSVMAIDLMYEPHAPPPARAIAAGCEEHAVYLIAAAKLEHANVPGKGGECLTFRVPVKARQGL